MDILRGVIGNAIKDEPDVSVRASFKGREIAKLDAVGIHQVGSEEIEILSVNAIHGGVEVFARVWDADGNQRGFGLDGSVDIERFRIFNPPIFVPDGTRTPDLVNGTEGRSNYKEDPLAAVLHVVAHSAKKAARPGTIIRGKIGNTTSTFFPSLDGRWYRAGVALSEDFATIRAGAGTGGSNSETEAVSPSLASTAVSGEYGTNAGMSRTGIAWDTSALPDTDDISSATFSWKSDLSTPEDLGGALGLSSWDGTEGFELANWGSTQFCSDFAFASINTDGATYNDIPLNASGIAAISKSGTTRFGFRLNYDIVNGSPTWSALTSDRTKTFFSEYSGGTTDDPKLTVVHAEPATTGNMFIVF